MGTPFVSVIIPAYGVARGLDRCLEHLARQTYPRGRFEVIVVDNGCPAIDDIVTRHHVRLLHEPRPGSYAARNTGVSCARGDVLAFTDDDCLPDREWLARGVAALSAGDATGIVAGTIDIIRPRPAHVWPTAYTYSSIFSFLGFENAGNTGATANLFVRRTVFERVGPFDERLLSGGDTAWGQRAAALGIPTRPVGEVLVVHDARPSIASVIAREARLAGGLQMRREGNGRPRRRAGLIREIVDLELRRRLGWSISLLRRSQQALTRRQRAQLAALIVIVQMTRAAERVRVCLGGTSRRA